MTSKALVKLPSVDFTRHQGKKTGPGLMALLGGKSSVNQLRQQHDVKKDGTTQIEQNIKFLQEQHQINLSALHQEVEVLRQRNKDLQFQLVFAKDTAPVPSSSLKSTSDGSTKYNIELLEDDLRKLRVSLDDAKNENTELKKKIEEQKVELESMEKETDKPKLLDVGIQAGVTLKTRNDFEALVKKAKSMVQLLRRENAGHDRKIATIKASLETNGNRGGNNSNNGRGRGGRNGYRRPYKGPPQQSGERLWREIMQEVSSADQQLIGNYNNPVNYHNGGAGSYYNGTNYYREDRNDGRDHRHYYRDRNPHNHYQQHRPQHQQRDYEKPHSSKNQQ